MPIYIDRPVKTPDDWENLKKLFDPDDHRRQAISFSEDLLQYYATSEGPVFLQFGGQVHGGHMQSLFGWFRDLMGTERLLTNFFLRPDWMHEMLDFWTDFIIRVTSPVLKQIKVDKTLFFADISYNKGPHISPQLWREFLMPCWKRITDHLRRYGVKLIEYDTDGNFEPLIPSLIEAGFNVVSPLEARCVDARDLREKYGKKLAFIGNIDKRALAAGGKWLEKEVNEKVPVLIEEGGYIPTIDHGIPSDVSFQNYLKYLELLKKNIFN